MSKRMTKVCPNCGADVAAGAQACPECGSCDRTGWGEEAHYGGGDLPEEEFDYDDFIQREFGEGGRPRGALSWFWLAVSALLAIALFGIWF